MSMLIRSMIRLSSLSRPRRLFGCNGHSEIVFHDRFIQYRKDSFQNAYTVPVVKLQMNGLLLYARHVSRIAGGVDM